MKDAFRGALARQGAPIGPYELLIAGQARTGGGLTLVTHNFSDSSESTDSRSRIGHDLS